MSSSFETNRLIKRAEGKLLSQLCEIADAIGEVNSDISLDPILYCDDDCNITGGVSIIRDEDDNILSVFFDSDLNPTPTPPTGSPCGRQCSVDYELVQNCFEDPDTCETYTQLITFLFRDGQEEQSSVSWIFPDGTITDTPPPGLRPCTLDCNCNPATESFTGNNATLDQFNSYQIIAPPCCELTITTSAGTITLPPQPNPYSFTQDFKCSITDYEISGPCIDDVTTILTRTGAAG